MSHRSARFRIASLSVLVCALAAAVLWRSPVRDVRTEDQNRDGRPDVWRVYDRDGRISQVTVDANFDGRVDVREYYEQGALVRRESDRNFNDRVDLVQEFDATTHQLARSVEDVDFDGRADVLVLFQGGRAVFSERSRVAAERTLSSPPDVKRVSVARVADQPLAALEDPFAGDLSVRSAHGAVGSGDCVGLSTSGGVPASAAAIASPLAAPVRAVCPQADRSSSADVAPYAPRGPPASLRFI